MKLPHAEVKFYPEVESQTSLSSLVVSCKRALIVEVKLSDRLLIYIKKIRVLI